MENVKNLLITGRPGSGKSTVIENVLMKLKEAGLKAGGFITPEIRVNGKRQGFKIVNILTGEEAIMADRSNKGKYRIGRYSVYLNVIDRYGVESLYQALENADIIVMDEIGKMELLSPRFRKAVSDALNSPKKVLGTIPLRSFDPFIVDIKRRVDCKILNISFIGFEETLKSVYEWLRV